MSADSRRGLFTHRVGRALAWAGVLLTVLMSGVKPLQAAGARAPLASGSLDLVGLQLQLPDKRIDVPAHASFWIPAKVMLGAQAATSSEVDRLIPSNATLVGVLTSPDGNPQTLQGTLKSGLLVPGLETPGEYVISDVRLETAVGADGKSSFGLQGKPEKVAIHCLGEVLITQVSSTPMNMQEIQDAGIKLGAGNYEGHRFDMTLSIGGNDVRLSVPVAIPIFDGLLSPVGGGSIIGRLDLPEGSIHTVPDLTVSLVSLVPETSSSPILLARPALAQQLTNNFKALLVIPGSIGFLHQMYRVNVAVFNTLASDSPYQISHLSATYLKPLEGEEAIRLISAVNEGIDDKETKPFQVIGPDGKPGTGNAPLRGSQNASATFIFEGTKEGRRPLDFYIQGQFEGGGLTEPIPLKGTAHGAVLVRNPTFDLVLVHPDVVRKGEKYVVEARLTNISQVPANRVSLNIGKKFCNVRLVNSADATKTVECLAAGETATFTFEFMALKTGEVQSSYLYMESGNMSFQLSVGIGERNIRLSPDTLVLPQTLNALPDELRESMLRVLGQAYSIATSKGALPKGVLPIQRATVTRDLANILSEQGLFLRMGADHARIWWDLWKAFAQNTDPGFEQLMRTTDAGAKLRAAFLHCWSSWADSSHPLGERLKDMAAFGEGMGDQLLVAIDGAEPGLNLELDWMDGSGTILTTDKEIPSLPGGACWAASPTVQFLQVPMQAGEKRQLRLVNKGVSSQALKVTMVHPQSGADPVLNAYNLNLDIANLAIWNLGETSSPVAAVSPLLASLSDATAVVSQKTETVPAEPFQVIGVHRYDLELFPDATPFGTQVMILFNRPTQALHLASGIDGFNAAEALVKMDDSTNHFWRKDMGWLVPDLKADMHPDGSTGTIDTSQYPPALTSAFPRIASCYFEKPVGPYIERHLTLSNSWSDSKGNGLGGERTWPILCGKVPGGALVKGQVRKLDGSGVKARISLWYYSMVTSNEMDLESGMTFAEEQVDEYYALISNNIDTDENGYYQLDYVPEPIANAMGPFLIQADIAGKGTAFGQASVIGNGQKTEMNLVLEGSGSVEGYVMDASGKPLQGVNLQAVQEQPSYLMTSGTGGGAFVRDATSDATGYYRVNNLKTGVFSIRALKESNGSYFGAAGSGEILKDGDVVRKDLLISGKTGTVRARVLDSNGQPVMDHTIALGVPTSMMKDGSAGVSFTYLRDLLPAAGSDGWVEFTNVIAGDVSVGADGYPARLCLPVQGYLESGKVLELTVHVTDAQSGGRVRIKVVDAMGQPVAGAYIRSPYENSYCAKTYADGLTDWIALNPGTHFKPEAYHPAWVQHGFAPGFMVNAGDERDNVLVQMPAKAGISGIVRRDGLAVKGAYVGIAPVYADKNNPRFAITNDQGYYVIADAPTDGVFQLRVVGPELLTSNGISVPPLSGNEQRNIDLTLPEFAHNRLEVKVYQPDEGSGKKLTGAFVWLETMLPNIGGENTWGLPSLTKSHAVQVPLSGTFTFTELPKGKFVLHASSDPLYPVEAKLEGSFSETEINQTLEREITLNKAPAGEIHGRIVQRDGQTPVRAGARVLLTGGGIGELEATSQADGRYGFPTVIPPGNYVLRIEDNQDTGDIASLKVEMKAKESLVRNLRLWGRGKLTLHAQDSLGRPLTSGDVVLTHSKAEAGLLVDGDLPDMAEGIDSENQGNFVFEDLIEGPIRIRVRNGNGYQGIGIAEIPAGGGDVDVSVRLQPIGRVHGVLRRPVKDASGNLEVVPAGRLDAYGNFNGMDGWLGVAPTATDGTFQFDLLPVGAVRLEAWDPETRQMGRATVNITEDQCTEVVIDCQDKGEVDVQVLQKNPDGVMAPVPRASLSARYISGPALNFTTEATTDSDGKASFMLPPGTYGIQATHPESLAMGEATLTRMNGDGAIARTIILQEVRSVFATVLPPPGAPSNYSMEGWKLLISPMQRAVALDAQGHASISSLPVGAYSVSLTDLTGRDRGKGSLNVTLDGGAIQTLSLTALAHGKVRVTLLSDHGDPIVDKAVLLNGGLNIDALYPYTDGQGQVEFLHVKQGSGTATGCGGETPFMLEQEGQQVEVEVRAAPTGSVHGVVMMPGGALLPHVEVVLGLKRTATDEQGRFRFDGLSLNRSMQLMARSNEGRIGYSDHFSLLAPDEDREANISILATGTLKGCLKDPLRASLPPLQISIGQNGRPITSTNVDASGNFEFSGLPAGLDLVFRALWDDGCTTAWEETFRIPDEAAVVEMNRTLEAFVNLKGWTKNRDLNNIPMTVLLEDSKGQVLDRAITTGELFDMDRPTFFFRYLKAGVPYQLVGLKEGTTTPIAYKAFTASGNQILEEAFLVESQVRGLTLRLRYPGGVPAPGTGIHALVNGTGPLGGVWNLAFNDRGEARIEALPVSPRGGTFNVKISDLPWQAPFTLQGTLLDQDGEQFFDIPVCGMGTLNVKAKTASGRATTQGRMNLKVQGQTLAGSIVDGGFQWAGVPIGEALRVEADGFALGSWSAVDLAPLSAHGVVRTDDVQVASSALLSGHLQDADGLPMKGVVQVFLASSQIGADLTKPFLHVPTAEDGGFLIEQLPLGQSLRLLYTDPSGDFASIRVKANLDAEALWDVNLKEKGLGSLHATVRRASDTPLIGAEITLTADDAPSFHAKTLENGEYTFDKIPALVWSAKAHLNVIGDQSQTVTVGHNQSAEAQWVDQGFTQLVGPLRRSSGQAFPAQTMLWDGLGIRAVATDGTFSGSFLPLGAGESTRKLSLKIQNQDILSWDQVLLLDGDTSLSTPVAFGLVRLKVVDPNGKPLAAQSVQTSWAGTLQTGSDGYLPARWVGQGVALNASLQNANSQGQVTGSISQDGQELELLLQPSLNECTLKVQLQNASGHVVSATASMQMSAKVGSETRVMTLQADGTFQVSVPTQQAVVVHLEGYLPGEAFEMSVVAFTAIGQSRTEILVVPDRGQIQGTLKDASGVLVAGATIRLLDGSIERQHVQVESGAFSFDSVNVGTALTVRAEMADGRDAEGRVQVLSASFPGKIDLQLNSLANLSVKVLQADGVTPSAGLAVQVSRGSQSLGTVSTGVDGVATFSNLPTARDLWVEVTMAKAGLRQKTTRLSAGTSNQLTFVDQEYTMVSGQIHRADGTLAFPAGSQIYLGGSAQDLSADGTFHAKECSVDGSRRITIGLSIAGLSLDLGSVPVGTNGQTVVDLKAPAFGTIQARVLESGQPVSDASVAWNWNHSGTSDAQGLGPIWYATCGSSISLQATKAAKLAWLSTQLDSDGQARVVDLALVDNSVSLPVQLTSDGTGFSCWTSDSYSDSNLVPLAWLADQGTFQSAALPSYGQWRIPGNSVMWTETRGDITLTQIATATRYGIRREILFSNSGAQPHRVRMQMQSGLPSNSVDLKLGTSEQVGGALFTHATLAWGKGSYVPTSMGWWPGGMEQALEWPELSLQPGDAKGLWVGQTLHGIQRRLPAGSDKAIERMNGQAPEWIEGLDTRVNLMGLPTIADTLPAWNQTKTLRALDPTGQPLERVTSDLPCSYTPNEPLAPIQEWYWFGNNTASENQGYAKAFVYLPPGGGHYTLGSFSGDFGDGAQKDVPLVGWSVLQFHATNGSRNGEAEIHRLYVGSNRFEWLSSALSSRWTMPAGSSTVKLVHGLNDGLFLQKACESSPDAFQLVELTYPNWGRVTLTSAGDFGTVRLSQGELSASASWSNGAYVFPAVALGRNGIQGGRWWYQSWFWTSVGPILTELDLTSDGQTTKLPLGVLRVSVKDGSGNLLPVNPDVVIRRDVYSQTVSGSSNPKSVSLIPGSYSLEITDPRTGGIFKQDVEIAENQTRDLVLNWGGVGNVAIQATAFDATVQQVYLSVQGADGGVRGSYTNASTGQARFDGVAEGSATITLTGISGSVSEDVPVIQKTIQVIAGQETPVAMSYPHMVNVTISGQTRAGDSVTSPWNYGMDKIYQKPGRRQITAYASGCTLLGVPVGTSIVLAAERSGLVSLNASPILITGEGQVLKPVFDLGRLVVQVGVKEGHPVFGQRVDIAYSGVTDSISTDANGQAIFTQVPMGASVTCSTTAYGYNNSSLVFTGPVQTVDMSYAEPSRVSVRLKRYGNFWDYYNGDSDWFPRADPGANGRFWFDSLSSSEYGYQDTAVWNALPRGVEQTITVTKNCYDPFFNRSVTLVQQLKATPSAASEYWELALDTRASLQFTFRDTNGNPVDSMPGDSITIKVVDSPLKDLVDASGTFDGAGLRPTTAKIFGSGTHTFEISSALWGGIGRVQVSIHPEDDHLEVEVPVTLPWVKTPLHLSALAGDGETPVVGASFIVKVGGNEGTLAWFNPALDRDWTPIDTNLWGPSGRTFDLLATYGAFGGDVVAGPYTATTGSDLTHVFALPLTVVRAGLNEPDGKGIEDLGAEFPAQFGTINPSDWPSGWPMVRIQGRLEALALGYVAGTSLDVTLYDTLSGLGRKGSITVNPLGQRTDLRLPMPDFVWMENIQFQRQDGTSSMLELLGVPQDAPGLLKPELANWSFDSSVSMWKPEDPRGSLGEAYCSFSLWGSSERRLSRLRVPASGQVWLTATWGESSGWGFLSYSGQPGSTLNPTISEFASGWTNAGFVAVDGNGKTLAGEDIGARFAHGPMYWDMMGVGFHLDPVDGAPVRRFIRLPIGIPVMLETSGSCTYWWGELLLTPTSTSPDPLPVLHADEQRNGPCE